MNEPTREQLIDAIKAIADALAAGEGVGVLYYFDPDELQSPEAETLRAILGADAD